jgi:hypothetical protein
MNKYFRPISNIMFLYEVKNQWAVIRLQIPRHVPVWTQGSMSQSLAYEFHILLLYELKDLWVSHLLMNSNVTWGKSIYLLFQDIHSLILAIG